MFRRYNLARKKHGANTFNHFCNDTYDLCPISNPHNNQNCLVAHKWPCSRQDPKAIVCPRGLLIYTESKRRLDHYWKMLSRYTPWKIGYKFSEVPRILNPDWILNLRTRDAEPDDTITTKDLFNSGMEALRYLDVNVNDLSRFVYKPPKNSKPKYG